MDSDIKTTSAQEQAQTLPPFSPQEPQPADAWYTPYQQNAAYYYQLATQKLSDAYTVSAYKLSQGQDYITDKAKQGWEWLSDTAHTIKALPYHYWVHGCFGGDEEKAAAFINPTLWAQWAGDQITAVRSSCLSSAHYCMATVAQCQKFLMDVPVVLHQYGHQTYLNWYFGGDDRLYEQYLEWKSVIDDLKKGYQELDPQTLIAQAGAKLRAMQADNPEDSVSEMMQHYIDTMKLHEQERLYQCFHAYSIYSSRARAIAVAMQVNECYFGAQNLLPVFEQLSKELMTLPWGAAQSHDPELVLEGNQCYEIIEALGYDKEENATNNPWAELKKQEAPLARNGEQEKLSIDMAEPHKHDIERARQNLLMFRTHLYSTVASHDDAETYAQNCRNKQRMD